MPSNTVAGTPLVVWSAPPSAELLHWLVDTLAPSELWLVGRETGDDALDGVVKAEVSYREKTAVVTYDPAKASAAKRL